MIVKSLHLQNFRCFKSLNVELHEELTVIAARNGKGKTAVLDALAIMLGTYVGAFDEGAVGVGRGASRGCKPPPARGWGQH